MQFKADQHCNVKLHPGVSKGKTGSITTLITTLYSCIRSHIHVLAWDTPLLTVLLLFAGWYHCTLSVYCTSMYRCRRDDEAHNQHNNSLVQHSWSD